MSQQANRINHLATTIHQWVAEKVGHGVSELEEIEKVIKDHLDKQGLNLVDEDKIQTEAQEIPVLLQKKKEQASIAKRMRELAGIPHKDNFV